MNGTVIPLDPAARSGRLGARAARRRGAAPRPCPICAKPSSPALHPFCSPRCRTLDLARWLDGSYRIPAEPDEEGAEGPDADSGAGADSDAERAGAAERGPERGEAP